MRRAACTPSPTDGKSIKRQPKPTNLAHVSHRRLEHLTERPVSKSTTISSRFSALFKLARFRVSYPIGK